MNILKYIKIVFLKMIIEIKQKINGMQSMQRKSKEKNKK